MEFRCFFALGRGSRGAGILTRVCGIAGIVRVREAVAGPSAARARAENDSVTGSAAAMKPTSVDADPVAIPEGWLDALASGIAHRGPDGTGRYRDRARRADGRIVEVGLVHARMTILDAEGGRQPMVRRDRGGETAIVFNGCVYNHRELRRELAASGERFETDHSDTEAMLRAYAVWGSNASRWASRLDGMFAAAVWDRARARLVLARDRAGEKPLYAATFAGGVFAFASTVPALLALRRLVEPATPIEFDPALVIEWLALGAADRPPIRGLTQVPPACVAIGPGSAPGEFSTQPYWSPPPRAPAGRPHPLTPDTIDRLLEESVRARLDADVPLGCFLSGGIDSPLVAAHAKRLAGRLHTFTVRMPDAAYDEAPVARQIARRLGSTHDTLDCDAKPAEDLVRLIEQLGLPLGDSSLLPTHWVSRAAGRHVKVALTGDGGDELFGGYERYRAAPILARARPALRLVPSWPGRSAQPKSLLSKLSRLGDAARGWGYADLLAIFGSRDLPRLLGVSGPLPPPVADPRDDAPRADFTTYLPADLLRKVDTASMAVPIEVRAPLLATTILDAALSAPLAELMPRGRRKGLLRHLAARYLPIDVINRPKSGFAIPISGWLRTDFGSLRTLMRDLLAALDAFAPIDRAVPIDPRAVTRMMDEHDCGSRDHGQRLYAITAVAAWCRWLRRR